MAVGLPSLRSSTLLFFWDMLVDLKLSALAVQYRESTLVRAESTTSRSGRVKHLSIDLAITSSEKLLFQP
jgi:hypothetical protein